MPTTLRAALACAAMLFCALLPASATASGGASRSVEAKILYRAASVPTDELFEEQWSLSDDRLLGVQSAWDVTTGGNVTVAVIDTGADLDHPDLRDNLWRNTREVPGNGVDDDCDAATPGACEGEKAHAGVAGVRGEARGWPADLGLYLVPAAVVVLLARRRARRTAGAMAQARPSDSLAPARRPS